MGIRRFRNLLRTLTAFSALVAAAAFGQDSCSPGYICFERGEAKLESPDDIARFIAAHLEKLGLTGKETFRCSIHAWLTQSSGPDRRPQYVYDCQQPFVRGTPAKHLLLRIGFWSRDGDVSSVRCRCAREDVRLPRPTVGRRQAEERGLRYFYARFPEVAPESIAVIDSQDPVIQWDFRHNGVRLARNIRYRFPLPPAAQRFTTDRDGEVTVSVDALDESVLRAAGAQLYIFWSGIPETAIEELNATLAAMPLGEEQFDVAQGFLAFRLRGETEAELIEQRLKSRARWEPDVRGRFSAFFADTTSAGQLAAFLEDHDLRMLSAGFQYMYGGQLRHGSLPAQPGDSDPPAAVIRDAFERARASTDRDISSALAESDQELEGLTFSNVVFEMRHADALRLYEKERGKRLLTVSPVDQQIDVDVWLDALNAL